MCSGPGRIFSPARSGPVETILTEMVGSSRRATSISTGTPKRYHIETKTLPIYRLLPFVTTTYKIIKELRIFLIFTRFRAPSVTIGKKDIFITLGPPEIYAMNSKISETLADLEQKFLTAKLTKRQFVFMSFKAIKNNTIGAGY